MPATVYYVFPCYNEEKILKETINKVIAKLNSLILNGCISEKSRAVLVDDGSKDKTWDIISSAVKENNIFLGVKLSRNYGHQNALIAGLTTVKDYADVIITMDADLQDDIDATDEMIKKFNDGNEIVYGVRSSRKSDSFFKRNTARAFYKIMKLMGADIVYDHADFRLMSRRAVDLLCSFSEKNMFLRGIVPLIGLKSDKVFYERKPRTAGETKYPLSKMFSFAINGITSFSVKPLKMITFVGVSISFLSLIALIWAIIGKLTNNTETGWSSIMCSIWFIGGLQIFFIGIIGEYIGKIYIETKHRPGFIIETVLGCDSTIN